MPLAGNLRQFALPDVLRVIENGQRTGRLLLRRGDRQAAIYFSGGQWLLCDRIGSNLVLAHHLARVGLVTAEQFESTLGIPFVQAGSIPDVQTVRALITSRQLTQDQLRSYAESDALEMLTLVLSWPDGDFAFEDGVPIPPGRVALPLPISMLISQAMRLTQASAPSRQAAPLAPETVIDFAEVDPASGAAIKLTRDQWRLLTAVDGQMPLWAIVDKLQAPEQVILRLAGELVAAGTVVVAGRANQG